MTASMKEADVASALESFHPATGSIIERLLFNNRLLVIVICALVTIIAVTQLGRLTTNASFEKTIPVGHPFIANYLGMKSDLPTPNVLRVVLSSKGENIYDPEFLENLRTLTNELIALPGVDRASLKSLWTPNARWQGVTEDGFDGGALIPDDYQGRPGDMVNLRTNVQRSGEIGQIVALDEKSALVSVPLLTVGSTNVSLDYRALDNKLEDIRARYEAKGFNVFITGFAKVVGDLLSGIAQIAGFFLLSIFLAVAVLFYQTRCIRSTLLVVACSLVAVLWQLSALPFWDLI